MWLQRHDEASQHSGTPKWAELDDTMDFSQPLFGDSMPSQHDQRRVSYTAASLCSAAENNRPLLLIFARLSATPFRRDQARRHFFGWLEATVTNKFE